MARGDGMARRGKTRAVKAPAKKAPAKRPAKAAKAKSSMAKPVRMAIGGNPGDMATGGFGTGMSGVTGSVGGNRAAGNTGNNFGAGNRAGGNSGGGGGLGSSTREGGFAKQSASSKAAANAAAKQAVNANIAAKGRDMGPISAQAAREYGARNLARLGDLPAQSMAQAGIDPGRAQMLAGIYNDMANPGFDTITPGGKIADRIAPDMSGRVYAPGSYKPKNVKPTSNPPRTNNPTVIPASAPVRPSGASPAGMLARLGDLPAQAMTQAGMDSGRAQMMADIYNRQVFGPGDPDTFRNDAYGRRDNVKAGRPDVIRPAFKTSAEDMASIKPGYMTWEQAQAFTPFAQTPTGQELLAASKRPLTKAEALKLKEKFPPKSEMWANKGLASALYPAPKNPGAYDQYPATIDGYNFTVGVPKGAGINRPVGPKYGTWNEGVAPGAKTSGSKTKSSSTNVSPAGATSSSSQNFKAGDKPGGRQNDNRGDVRVKRKKKLLPEEGTTSTMKNGGRVRRTDGIAKRGKTRGRYI